MAGTGFSDTFLIHKTILKWKTHTTETRVSTFFVAVLEHLKFLGEIVHSQW